jgi:hypothetical protein
MVHGNRRSSVHGNQRHVLASHGHRARPRDGHSAISRDDYGERRGTSPRPTSRWPSVACSRLTATVLCCSGAGCEVSATGPAGPRGDARRKSLVVRVRDAAEGVARVASAVARGSGRRGACRVSARLRGRDVRSAPLT